jgi:hypothetical protein
MTAYGPPHRYALAFISSGSLGLITDESLWRQGLARLHDHLRPGASLLLEMSADSHAPAQAVELPPRTVHVEDGSTITCTASSVSRPDTVCYAGTYTHRQGDRVIATVSETLSLGLYPLDELLAALADSGLTSVQVLRRQELAFLSDSGCVLIDARVAAGAA